MGSTCEGETTAHQGFDLNMTEVENEALDRNLKRHQRDAPSKNYARRSNKRPRLLIEVEDTLTEELERNKLSPTKSNGVELPCYYLISRKAYYEGEWKGGKPNGMGKLYFEDGSYYEGPLINGQPSGQDAIFVYPDGSFKRGGVRDGLMNGFGKFFYKRNNFLFEGYWENDKPHGRGFQKFGDGCTYEGQFREGKKQDINGVYKWPNGKEYRGEFRDGYMDGQGVLRLEDKGQYSGTFEKNIKTLQTKMKTGTGEYDGPFKNGQMSGRGVFKWKDDKIYEGEFYKNQLHGDGTIFFPNGQMAKGRWHHGENQSIQQIAQGKSGLR